MTTAVTLPVTLSRASTATVTVVVSLRTPGTATAGTDFANFSTVTLTFSPGQTSKTVTLKVIGDAADEANETVVLQLGSPTNATIGTAAGMLTILDDDPALVASSIGPGTSAQLTPSQVRGTLARAVDWWHAHGVPAADLRSISVVIEPMAGDRLGQAVGREVHVDSDAAGWGWSTGSTVRPSRVDLLSVLVHEIGHVLGLAHTETGMMAPVLAPGIRTATTTTTASAVTDGHAVGRPAVAGPAVVGPVTLASVELRASVATSPALSPSESGEGSTGWVMLLAMWAAFLAAGVRFRSCRDGSRANVNG